MAGVIPLPQQDSVLPIIQLSITPVILISGLGSLSIAMTNRLGRIVDRSRLLAGAVQKSTDSDERAHLELQLRVMFRRAKLMRAAMTCGVLSMFFSALLILGIFLSAVFQFPLTNLMLGLFGLSVLSLLGCLSAFIRDVFLSLHAVADEVSRALDASARSGK